MNVFLVVSKVHWELRYSCLVTVRSLVLGVWSRDCPRMYLHVPENFLVHPEHPMTVCLSRLLGQCFFFWGGGGGGGGWYRRSFHQMAQLPPPPKTLRNVTYYILEVFVVQKVNNSV